MRHCFNFLLTPTQKHMISAFKQLPIGFVAGVKEEAHSVLCPSLATQDLSFFLLPLGGFSQQLTQKCQGHCCYLQNNCRFLKLSTCLFGSDPASALAMVRPPLLWLHWHIICSPLSPKHPPSSFPTYQHGLTGQDSTLPPIRHPYCPRFTCYCFHSSKP